GRGVLRGQCSFADLPVASREQPNHRLVDQGLLGSEVVADGGEIGARSRRDVTGGRAGIALRLQTLDRTLDQLVAVAGLSLRSNLRCIYTYVNIVCSMSRRLRGDTCDARPTVSAWSVNDLRSTCPEEIHRRVTHKLS